MILSMEQLHDKYQAGIRHDQQEQSKRKFRDPERHDPLRGLYVLYVWRKKSGHMVWLLAGFARLKPTPARVRRWRKRLRIQRDEILRVVELKIAWRTGAGGKPLLTLHMLNKHSTTELVREPTPLRTLKTRKPRFRADTSYTNRMPVRAARTRMRRKGAK